jgi:hypothetical protein
VELDRQIPIGTPLSLLEKKENFDDVLFSESGSLSVKVIRSNDHITKCIGATAYQSPSYIRD